MSTPATRISDILLGVECDKRPLSSERLHGHLLLDEVAKLALMTLAFHLADQNNMQYRAPFQEMRSTVSLRELLEFAANTDHSRVASFYKIALKDSVPEMELAKNVLTLYRDDYAILSSCLYGDSPIPSEGLDISMEQALGRRPGTNLPETAAPAARPK